MIYPKAVYKIGNKFEIENGELVTFFEGVFMRKTKELFGYSDYRVKEHKLHSITAETLAELAITKGDQIEIYWRSVYCAVSIYNKDMVDYSKKKDEPLGEFFLRVAIARNYITE